MEAESSLLPTIDVDQIEHASHVHPLTLCDKTYKDCSICGERSLDRRTYGCNQCNFFLHESCSKIQIPQEIYHEFHPHPLRLAIKEIANRWDYRCISCYRLLFGLIFECPDCKFYMDIECALLPAKLKQDGCIDHIQHFNHPHPLILCDEEKKIHNNFCHVCEGVLSKRPRFSYDTLLLSEGSESIYGCLNLRCEFFLHERCARLPPKIDSPFNPGHHSLSLIWSDDHPICQGCHRITENCYTYQCPGSCKFSLGSCNFVLDLECAFLRAPVLKFKSHEHLLTLFPSVKTDLCCHICNMTCSSNIFRCIDCDYNLHLHCGPLPCSIKDKCHIDPLNLRYAFVEDGYEDDTVYCDACEQPRDPDECGYYCKDCNFFAELKCVEDEVLRSLNGERGNVKLRTANKTRIRVGAKLINNFITDNGETDSDNEIEDISAKYLEVKLHENFFSGCYTDEEYDQVIEIFDKARVQLRSSSWILQESNKALYARIELAELPSEKKQELDTYLLCYSSDEESDYGENSIPKLSSRFTQHIRGLDHFYYEDDQLLEMFFRGHYDIVRIGHHKIAQDSAPVLKGLLHKYDDFTAKTKLSERLKAIFLTMFCQVIHEMCLTNVRDVKTEVLLKWWKSLKLVQHSGFEIEFAIDQLYKVMQATAGITFKTMAREMKSEVDKVSLEIEEKEAELEAEMRELEVKKRNLEAKKIKLEEDKSDADKYEYAMECSSSPVIKECLKQVSELKWKKAWDGSPIMFL